MQRRNFLKGAAALLGSIPINSALSADPAPSTLVTPTPAPTQAQTPAPDASAHLLSGSRPLAPILATPDRIIEMNVCTRPFRLQGPRIESERIGRKQVVHNYGHGGSGWSLSWGTGKIAVEMAQAHGRRELAVIGCGAIGLTTALVAQQAGLKVTIYAKERPPYASSHRATGSFTPDSRIVSAQFAPQFARQWEMMARYSFRRFQSYLGVDGHPIEWRDMYNLADLPPGTPRADDRTEEPDYPDLERALLRDITPQTVAVSSHPFPALLGDDSIIPVRGQTAKLIPQPEVDYGFFYGARRVSVYPRRDGLLVQAQAEGDYNNDSEALDANESISAVQRLGEIVAQMG